MRTSGIEEINVRIGSQLSRSKKSGTGGIVQVVWRNQFYERNCSKVTVHSNLGDGDND